MERHVGDFCAQAAHTFNSFVCLFEYIKMEALSFPYFLHVVENKETGIQATRVPHRRK